MPLYEAEYSKSKMMYAVDPTSFQVDTRPHTKLTIHGCVINALWTITKNNVVKISEGTIYYSFHEDPESPKTHIEPTFENFLLHADSRYGGSPRFKWDGTFMYAPETSLAKMNKMANFLDPLIGNLPNVPADYLGWYSFRQPTARGVR